MKKYLFILLILLWGGVAAEEPLQRGEFQVYFYENNYNETFFLRVTILSTECWDAFDANWGTGYEDHHPTTEAYNYYNEISAFSVSQTNGEHIGLDLCYSDQGHDPVLGLGKYKIDIIKEIPNGGDVYYVELATFNMDYRTSAYPEQAQDIGFKYYVNTGVLKAPDGTVANNTNQTCWDLSDRIDWSKDYLQLHDPSNLSVNDGGSYPQLSWARGSNALYFDVFEIERAVGSQSFTKIAEINSSANGYIDTDYVTGRFIKLTYRVRSKNGSLVSQYTNTAFTYGDLYKDVGNKVDYTFALKQNYPNPFNPTTTIKYSIPSENEVTIKVYDNLGNEVAELLNELQTAGEYSINFNGKNLSSGIYFYSITAGKYSDTKKFILVK